VQLGCAGTTTVLEAGGCGLLLLKLRHPDSASGNSKANRNRRMGASLASESVV
jgi:hypothetical protein